MGRMTRSLPKCLLKIGGKTLLDWQIEALHGAGIREICIVTGYCRELLAHRGLREFHNPHWATTNMVFSLARAEEWLMAGPCVVTYADIFYGAGAVRRLLESRAAITVAYDPKWQKLWAQRFENPLEDAETFRISRHGHILEIGRKPKSAGEIQGQYMGLLKFTPRGWQAVEGIRSKMRPAENRALQMTQALDILVQANRVEIKALPWRGFWGEVDQIRDLEIYRQKRRKPGSMRA